MTDDTIREREDGIGKEYSLQGFHKVDASSAIEFEITQAPGYSVKATGDEKLIERLGVEVSDDTLMLRLGSGFGSFWGRHTEGDVRVIITMPELVKLTASGAARGTARGFSSDKDFDLELSGASQAEIGIEAGKATLAVSGAGRVSGELKARDTVLKLSGASRSRLTGAGGDARLDSSGASRADLTRFEIKNADVNVSGAGRARINMNGTLNAELSGASSLEYAGTVVLGRKRVTGASKMHQA